MIKKSFGASLAIAIGAYGILVIENPIASAVLFALGLTLICYQKLNLFTGKCGYYIQDFNELKINLWIILFYNLLFGYSIGLIMSYMNSNIVPVAEMKVTSWTISTQYFLLSIMCGIIMFIAVHLFKEKNSLMGIIYGIPIFILCGYQHSIANAIYMGCARTFNPAILICIIGNFIGSIIASFILLDNQEEV